MSARNSLQGALRATLTATSLLLAGLVGSAAHAITLASSTVDFKQLGTGGAGNSAVQITENWVLTARHVSLVPGSTFSNGLGSSTVAARYDFSSASFPENDLSLIRLSTAVVGAQLSLLADVYANGAIAPTAVTIASAQNNAPRGFAFATMREAVDTMDPDGGGPLPPIQVNFLLTSGDLTDGPYVQGGDSGGALFLGHVLDSTSPLMGIASAQTQYMQGNVLRYGSAFVQLSKYRNWIDGTMAADQADAQMANWVLLAVPEPSTIALWALGGGWLLWRSKRSLKLASRGKPGAAP